MFLISRSETSKAVGPIGTSEPKNPFGAFRFNNFNKRTRCEMVEIHKREIGQKIDCEL